MDSHKTPVINTSSISNILTLRYNPIGQSTLSKATWKDFSPTQTNQYEENVKNLLTKNIRQQIQPESNLVIALSGGIDSTLLLSLVKETIPNVSITAITVTFPSSDDESKSAADIASFFDVKHKIIHVGNFLNELPMAISILQEPYYDVMNWYYLVKHSSQFSNMFLSGDGADELFGGYTFRYSKFLKLISSSSTIREKTKSYLECHERDWVPDQENIFQRKMQFSWNKIYEIIDSYFDNELTPTDQIFLADYNGKLMYNFIPNYDKFYNHFKIKSITPFLDSNLITYAQHIPHEKKYDVNKNIGKIILRNLLDKKLTRLLYHKPKQGFAVNTVSLWDMFGKEICKKFLFDSRAVKDGWISYDWIKNNFSKTNNEKDTRYINKYLSLLGFEIWYRIFITKEMNPNEKI